MLNDCTALAPWLQGIRITALTTAIRCLMFILRSSLNAYSVRNMAKTIHNVSMAGRMIGRS